MKWYSNETYPESAPEEIRGKQWIRCKKCNLRASEFTDPKMSKIIDKDYCPKCRWDGQSFRGRVEFTDEYKRMQKESKERRGR